MVFVVGVAAAICLGLGYVLQQRVAATVDGERSSLNGDTNKYFYYPKLAAVYCVAGLASG